MRSQLSGSFPAGLFLAGVFCGQISLGQTDNGLRRIINHRLHASKLNSDDKAPAPSGNPSQKNASAQANPDVQNASDLSTAASMQRPALSPGTFSQTSKQKLNAQAASFAKNKPAGSILNSINSGFARPLDELAPSLLSSDDRPALNGESGNEQAADEAGDDDGKDEPDEDDEEAEAPEPWTLFQLPRLEQHGVRVRGWLAQGFTWNPDRPQNRSNGVMGMNDRANDYLFNQLGLILEKPVVEDPCNWSFGGRATLMYGADARFVQAFGFDDEWNSGRFVALAMPELYADVFLPWGKGASLRLGRFWTPIGYEGVPALDRFFHSATNAFTLAEPSTHTGALLKYPLTEQWTVQGGVVQGWDVWQDNNDSLAALGALCWISQDEQTTVTGVFYSGDETADLDDNQFTYSFMLTHELTDRWRYVFWNDFNTARDVAFTSTGDPKNGQWFAFTNALFYAVDDEISVGCRFEYYRDDDGVTIFDPISDDNLGPGDLFGLTLGVNYTPTTNLLIRPEIRWDWANRAIPYDDQSDRQQFTGSCDAVWQF